MCYLLYNRRNNCDKTPSAPTKKLSLHHRQESLCGTERILPVSLSGRTDPEKSDDKCGDDKEKQFSVGAEQRKLTGVRNGNDFHAGGD